MSEADESSSSTEIRRGMQMTREIDGRPREQVFFERIISRVEPDIKGSSDRLALYVQLWERELINDTNTFPTNVSAEWVDGTVKLTGFVGYQENRDSLDKIFHYMGFESIDNQVEVLPSADLGELRYGYVSQGRAFIFSAPTTPRETLTEFFFGDPLFLLKDVENDHLLVYGSDGYVGYIDRTAVQRVDSASFREHSHAPKAALTRNAIIDDKLIPAGATLALVSRDTDFVELRSPSGSLVTLPNDHVLLLPEGPDPRALQAIAVAKSKLETRYVWGGKTSEGIDCSGLVQSSYLTMGINMPRDTYMQHYVGRLVATRWFPQGMQPGDLMFFINNHGRINHVAIYVGGEQFIEAAGPGVQLTSMNPDAENYDGRRTRSFAFAKRVFN